MKAIILAAGRGSRLGERTKDRPKCMCTLQGRTLLDRCLETLEQAGIPRKEAGIVTGYRSDMFAMPDVICFHNEIWEQTNMFYSLTMADSWLKREPLPGVLLRCCVFLQSHPGAGRQCGIAGYHISRRFLLMTSGWSVTQSMISKSMSNILEECYDC